MFSGNSEAKSQAAPDSSTDGLHSKAVKKPVLALKENNAHEKFVQKNGVGIHTGKEVSVLIRNSSQEGIQFSYKGEDSLFTCPAHWERLSGTTRTTALVMRGTSRRKIQVAMIEHFMAAAHVWRLNFLDVNLNLITKLDGETVELPILDGSSLEWCHSLKPIVKVASEQPVWVVTEAFEHTDGERKILFEKTSMPLTQYEFEGKFGSIFQRSSFVMDWVQPGRAQEDFLQRIAPARTFGFKEEIEALRARGLALGGTLGNALVIDGDGFVNPEGQRIENELASHKLLDAIGDFALAAKPILGKISCKGSGHTLHLRSLKLAFESGCLKPGFLMSDGKVIVACK